MWRRKDLLRFTGKSDAPRQIAEDILIDAQALAALCSISRSMVYKMNEQAALPQPIQYGRTLRWSFQAIEEWVVLGCPPRRPPVRKKKRK
jgi:predicted DNA-binding transcriptional regulator AlpA